MRGRMPFAEVRLADVPSPHEMEQCPRHRQHDQSTRDHASEHQHQCLPIAQAQNDLTAPGHTYPAPQPLNELARWRQWPERPRQVSLDRVQLFFLP